ncbi:MAG: GNAT family N-acetyltransferase [Rhodospirillales bacterium]|nr:GNAT family N-acetyltransferase [Rhodospirillales bacterium]
MERDPAASLIECSPVHAGVLAELHGVCFPEPWAADAFLGLLNPGGASALILHPDEDGGEPAGFILWRLNADEAEIITFGVTPNYRRRGFARILAISALDRSLKAGAQNMYLEVAESNTGARRLYESLGFKAVGRRQNYYHVQGKRIDALVYALSIKNRE